MTEMELRHYYIMDDIIHTEITFDFGDYEIGYYPKRPGNNVEIDWGSKAYHRRNMDESSAIMEPVILPLIDLYNIYVFFSCSRFLGLYNNLHDEMLALTASKDGELWFTAREIFGIPDLRGHPVPAERDFWHSRDAKYGWSVYRQDAVIVEHEDGRKEIVECGSETCGRWIRERDKINQNYRGQEGEVLVNRKSGFADLYRNIAGGR